MWTWLNATCIKTIQKKHTQIEYFTKTHICTSFPAWCSCTSFSHVLAAWFLFSFMFLHLCCCKCVLAWRNARKKHVLTKRARQTIHEETNPAKASLLQGHLCKNCAPTIMLFSHVLVARWKNMQEHSFLIARKEKPRKKKKKTNARKEPQEK